MDLETHLKSIRKSGRPILVPYITGGITNDWMHLVEELAHLGADAIEIGIPFSDPMIDGPVIQEASNLALQRGATTESILLELAQLNLEIPLVAMTYYNLVLRADPTRFANWCHEGGVSGTIIPDLPPEEMRPLETALDKESIVNVLLIAPSTTDERLKFIAGKSKGFLYTIGVMGTTGERTDLAESATILAKRAKQVTDLPVLVGIGISNEIQAQEVTKVADGVVIGSAFMRRILEDQSGKSALKFFSSLRSAL
ncbi:MAG: tryptophan synthase subunit alpha [Acidimicrobiales bacterium]|nr:tryptophan synthase subunit alpha [Acidimicrobiales bacterium]